MFRVLAPSLPAWYFDVVGREQLNLGAAESGLGVGCATRMRHVQTPDPQKSLTLPLFA